MVRIVQKGFRDIGRLTDRRELDRFALLLEALDGFARAEPGLLTLLCGEADHRLGVWLSIHFVPPRFFERWSAGRCTSARTSSIPLIWSARSLAYISQPFSSAICLLFFKSSMVAIITGACSGVVTSLWQGPLSLVKQAFCPYGHLLALAWCKHCPQGSESLRMLETTQSSSLSSPFSSCSLSALSAAP